MVHLSDAPRDARVVAMCGALRLCLHVVEEEEGQERGEDEPDDRGRPESRARQEARAVDGEVGVLCGREAIREVIREVFMCHQRHSEVISGHQTREPSPAR